MLLFVLGIVSVLNTRAELQMAKLEVMHVGSELRRVGSFFAEDPDTAAVVLKDALDMFFRGYVWKDTLDDLMRLKDIGPAAEQAVLAASEVSRVMKLLDKNPKKAGVVLREVLGGVLAIENWPTELQEVIYYSEEKMIDGVMHEMTVKISDGMQGLAQILLLSLSSFENPETVVETLTEMLGHLADHRKELADDAAKISHVFMGDDPDSAVLFWKDLLRGMIGNDTKQGTGLVWKEVRGRWKGKGPIKGISEKGEARRMTLGLESTSTPQETDKSLLKPQAKQDRGVLARPDAVVGAEAGLEGNAEKAGEQADRSGKYMGQAKERSPPAEMEVRRTAEEFAGAARRAGKAQEPPQPGQLGWGHLFFVLMAGAGAIVFMQVGFDPLLIWNTVVGNV
jgi:hypothetical protein